ncbi:MAG: DNA internalization-related competence protein ComEC/Rec2 [Proteobacteria bacterium]|nr:MAG: DNA internalization-related competence protein ComEC/Rec2 [Pseudomonadota bacterium]
MRSAKPVAAAALGLLLNVRGAETIAPGAFVVTVLDVGQGLSTVVRTTGHTLVFDTGIRHGDRYDMGRIVVNPYLQAAGTDRLDALVISHADRDHSGGAAAVMAAHPEARLVSTDLSLDARAEACVAGQGWSWDGVRFDILWPDRIRNSERNNQSCVIQIRSEYGRALMTGDIEAAAEFALVQRHGASLRSELLIVPHHGSKTSTTDAFLRSVAPALSVLPRGLYNPYSHPHESVRERLDRFVPTQLDTAFDGAVTVGFGPRSVEIRAFRRDSRPLWRSQPARE